MAAATTQQPHEQLHVFFFPFMSPGHLIPMTDMARIFASHGTTKATIITTPQNISRFESIIGRDDNRQSISILKMDFPSAAANLPPNCESLDALPSRGLSYNFSKASMMLHPQADDLVRRYRPDAIVSDFNFPWTAEIARKYDIPRFSFHGTCCFSLCLSMAASQHKPNVKVSSETETFLVPGLPEPVYITLSHMPDRFFGNTGLHEFFEKIIEAERDTYGVVANTFFEIEPEYVKHYEKVTGKVVYPVGPVSLFNTKALDMAERGGNKASNIGEEDRCVSWLDSKKSNSVLYVCFGSLCEFSESQLLEIASGLESSKASFIWVVKDSNKCTFLTDDFEERIEGRGLFYNENLVVTRLRVGIAIGVQRGLAWGEEENIGVLIKRDRVEEVVTRLINNNGGHEKEVVEEMRRRVSELSELARLAVCKGGSSYVNVDILITDLLNHKKHKKIIEKNTLNGEQPTE
ncbi:hypothetical protein JRO89_XS12G0026900 [Xanthoceras sorbifolium]|uniref:Uncharacterized protein n=1 Tax=Xanthoceras sorbifolium TaxID=99658 RepID=A0ABQ8HAP0_9ROSI|nr:hypothetical protein JRO89_XS12G0026900 [Xanthoceras sorbifolium]